MLPVSRSPSCRVVVPGSWDPWPLTRTVTGCPVVLVTRICHSMEWVSLPTIPCTSSIHNTLLICLSLRTNAKTHTSTFCIDRRFPSCSCSWRQGSKNCRQMESCSCTCQRTESSLTSNIQKTVSPCRSRPSSLTLFFLTQMVTISVEL